MAVFLSNLMPLQHVPGSSRSIRISNGRWSVIALAPFVCPWPLWRRVLREQAPFFTPTTKGNQRWKRVILGVASLLTLLCMLGLAQPDQSAIKDDFQPSTLNQPGQQYPQVNSQGYARFRIIAPHAQSVSVILDSADVEGQL